MLDDRPDEELRLIAVGMVDGTIYSSLHLEPHDDLAMIFMPIALMSEVDRISFFQNCGLIYEYVSKASPVAINGSPSFFSMNFVSLADTEKLRVFVKEYAAVKKAFLSPK